MTVVGRDKSPEAVNRLSAFDYITDIMLQLMLTVSDGTLVQS